jgi:predicted RNA-binding protein with PIN domain
VSKTYLIDGYNLLHQVEEESGSLDLDLQSRRERLLGQLAALADGRRGKMIVVFDGSGSRNQKQEVLGLEVRYVPAPADNFIRQEIARNQHNRNLVVVTSDRKDIGEYARVCGVTWMTSPQFWQWFTTKPRSRLKSGHPAEGSRGAPKGWTAKDDEELWKAFTGGKK